MIIAPRKVVVSGGEWVADQIWSFVHGPDGPDLEQTLDLDLSLIILLFTYCRINAEFYASCHCHFKIELMERIWLFLFIW